MVFVMVDNNNVRLRMLSEKISEMFHECKIVRYTDPMLSARYICNNKVDVVIAYNENRPVGGAMLEKTVKPHSKARFFIFSGRGVDLDIAVSNIKKELYLAK